MHSTIYNYHTINWSSVNLRENIELIILLISQFLIITLELEIKKQARRGRKRLGTNAKAWTCTSRLIAIVERVVDIYTDTYINGRDTLISR